MHFKIYRSSAGSGKTYTLTKEYLKLVLAAPGHGAFDAHYFKHILAVTFTNDAADEMKARILKQLSKLAQLPENQQQGDGDLELIASELAAEFPNLKLSKADICRRAAWIHEAMLHNYTDFAVSTIDKFNNRIVQTFKKDLNIPYHYEIELDADELLEGAAVLLQEQAGSGENQYLEQLLVDFAIYEALEGRSWFISRNLEEAGKALMDEDKRTLLDETEMAEAEDFLKLKDRMMAYAAAVEQRVAALGQEALRLTEQQGLAVEDFPYGSTGYFGYFLKCSDPKHPKFFAKANKRMLAAIEKNEWTSKKARKDLKIAIEAISQDLVRIYKQIEAIREAEEEKYLLAKALSKQVFLMGTLNALNQALEAVKAKKGVIHISDTTRRINEIVESEPVPFIYERMGARYFHILIDEFQDTSRQQWHNLIPLIVTALARDTTSMVVGDSKQAIYRWRGGKAEMLVDLPKVPTLTRNTPLKQDALIFTRAQNPQVLDKNWRSHQEVISFNNQFFSYWRDLLAEHLPALQEHYREVAQQTNKQAGGHVELITLADPAKDRLTNKELKPLYLAQVEQLIRQSKTEGYDFGDIAILTSRKSDGAYLAEGLLNAGIPVVSRDSLLLSSSPAVRFLTGMMRLSLRPDDHLLKASLLGFVAGQQSDESQQHLLWLADHLETSDLFQIGDYWQQRYRIAFDSRQFWQSPLYEKLTLLIRAFGLHQDQTQQAYLAKLLDITLEFANKHGNNLDAFLQYWERKREDISISLPKGHDAVQVMTIHKSKGLQFPIVIVPFADWGTSRNRDHLWLPHHDPDFFPELGMVIVPAAKSLMETRYAKEIAAEKQAIFLDNFNKLYVALTRPEEKLYLLCRNEQSSGSGKTAIFNNKGEISMPSVSKMLCQFAHDMKLHKTTKQHLEAEPQAYETHHIFWAEHRGRAMPGKPRQWGAASSAPSPDTFTDAAAQPRLRRQRHHSELFDIAPADYFSDRLYGLLVHEALSHVTYRSDIPEAVRHLVSRGMLSQAQSANMVATLQQVTALPDIAAYFDPDAAWEVLNETEIIGFNQREGRLEIARPDRIMRRDRQAILLDYKTGQPRPAHQQQLDGYSSLLVAAGLRVIRKILVYVETQEVQIEDRW